MSFRWTNKLTYESSLRIFAALFSLIVAWMIWWARHWLTSDYATVDPQNHKFLNGIITTLILLLLASPLLWKQRGVAYLIIASLFFVLFKFALLPKNPPLGLYQSWGHAIIFWAFLCLALSRIWTAAMTFWVLKFLVVICYFSAGLAKLGQDPAWTNGFTLQHYVLGRMLHGGDISYWRYFADLEWAKALSWCVLIGELLTPLALFRRSFEVAFVILTLAFQIVAWTLIDIQWLLWFGWVYLAFPLSWLGQPHADKD